MAARASAALVMPQILTRIMAVYLQCSQRRTAERGKRGGGIRRKHEMSADEEGVEPGGLKLHEIVVRAQAGFADGDAIVGDPADQFEGCFDADGERFEVAVVYADDAGAASESAVELIGRVNLDERLHANLAAQGDEVAKQRIFKYGDDEAKAIRVVGASFPDLPGIEDKILAQNRELDRLAGVAEIFQRAAEELAFGQNGESGSARGLQSLREGYGIEWIAKDTA